MKKESELQNKIEFIEENIKNEKSLIKLNFILENVKDLKSLENIINNVLHNCEKSLEDIDHAIESFSKLNSEYKTLQKSRGLKPHDYIQFIIVNLTLDIISNLKNKNQEQSMTLKLA